MCKECTNCIVYDLDSMAECNNYTCIISDDVYDTYGGNYSSRDVYGCKKGNKVWYINSGYRVDTCIDENFEEEYDKDEIEFLLSQID